jgi:hypothetical protein
MQNGSRDARNGRELQDGLHRLRVEVRQRARVHLCQPALVQACSCMVAAQLDDLCQAGRVCAPTGYTLTAAASAGPVTRKPTRACNRRVRARMRTCVPVCAPDVPVCARDRSARMCPTLRYVPLLYMRYCSACTCQK